MPDRVVLRPITQTWATVLAVLGALMVGLALAPQAQARESLALAGSYDFAGQFGVGGPGMMAIHQASDTLYVVDAPNNRILSFDIADPLNPVPESFTALGGNEITQAGGDPLALEQLSNLAVDNSGGPQDGTIYLATGPAAPAAHAFAATGEWLYQFAHDGDGNFDPSGTPRSALAVAVSDSETNPGEIFLVGTQFGGTDTSLYGPSDTSGGNPSVIQTGTTGGYARPAGSYSARFTPDGSGVRAIKKDSLGSALAGGSKYETEGLAYEGEFAFFSGFFGAPEFDGGFTYDGDELFVRTTENGGSIARIRQTGIQAGADLGTEVVDRFAFGEQGTGVGIIGTSTNYMYASNASNSEIRIFQPVVAPDAEIHEPVSVDLNTAGLSATVNAQDLTVTTCEFEWGTTDAYGNTEPCNVIPTGDQDVEVTAQIPVTPRTTYHARIVLFADNNTRSVSDDLEFQAPDLPEVVTLPAGPQQRLGTALLGGTVDPNQTPTSFYIEYSTDPSLSNSSRYPVSENASVEVSDNPVRVSQIVDNLENDTTYYFRVVAATKAGSDTGAIESFTTFVDPSAPQPTTCDNSEFRSGPSRSLPDCRAWEQISAYDKGAGQASQGATIVAPGGNRVSYVASSAFQGAQSLGSKTEYMASRDDGDWSTQAMAPGVTIPITVQLYNAVYSKRTPDLSRAIGTAYNIDLPGTARSNTTAYLWDAETGQNRVVVSGAPAGSGQDVTVSSSDKGVGIADDGMSGYVSATRVPVDSGPMLPSGQQGVYWWNDTGDNFDVELASVLPNGDPGVGGNVQPQALSTDGNRVLWLGQNMPGRSGAQELYVSRRDGSTQWISEAQGTSQPAGTQANVTAWTPDLRYVYFTSRNQLTADSTASTFRPDLYRYDTETGQLDDLTTQDTSGADARGVMHLSDDGSHVYFLASGNLTADATGSGIKLYGLEDGGLRLITDYPGNIQLTSKLNFANTNGYERQSKVTGGGRYFLFPYSGNTTGTRLNSVYETDGHQMYYRYDWDRDRIDCVTCSPVGSEATSDAYLTMPVGYRENATAPISGVGRERRFMTEDGRVMFNTAQQLVTDGDNDSKVDTYIWDGDLRLLTRGSGDYDQFSEDATAGFEDIYVVSSDQLVPRDTDGAADIFVASINGGLASQQTRPIPDDDGCQGPACQGLGSEAPELRPIEPFSPDAASQPGSQCTQQREKFRRTTQVVAKRMARFQQARRVARVSIQRRKRGQMGRKRAAASRRNLKKARAQVQRVAPVHKRAKKALIQCRGGRS